MRRPQNSSTATMAALLLTATALPSLVAANLLDCKDVVVDGTRYNFDALGGPRSVHYIQDQPPSVLNTTFTIDLCHPLKPVKGVDKKDQCPQGTKVCGVTTNYNPADNTSVVSKVVPIAGNYAMSGGHLEPRWTKLKGSDSNADAEKEGLRLELKGGKYPFSSGKKGIKQKALVEFICDHNRTGTETDLDNRDTEEPEKGGEEKLRRLLAREMSAREDKKDEEGDGGDEEGGDEGDDTDDDDDDDKNKPDKSKALQFVSYKEEDDIDVLRLTWYTKFACEDGGEDGGSGGGGGSKSEHWGFFTWFIIVLFLCIAAYIIFGSWLNYERYGARGWDAIPHGDTIRDLPYLVKDFGRRVTSSLQGGGSRGGYSAV